LKNVVVIGAGISGLTAAIYAQRSGFDVTLCEQNSRAGGMCSSWMRKGYLFEGSIHCTGSNPTTALYKLWKATGALGDNVKMYLPDIFHAVEWNGQVINLFRNIEKTVEQLAVMSPEDSKQLQRLVKDVKAFSCLQMPIFDIRGIKTKDPKRMTFNGLLKIMPALPRLARLHKVSCKKYLENFKHLGIRRLFRIIPDDYSSIGLIATLATWNMGDGGFPEGGSLQMIDRMVKTFEDLGGKMLLKTKVEKDDYSSIGLIATLATWNMGDGGFPEGGSLQMIDRMVKTFEDLGGKMLLKTKVEKVSIENGMLTGVVLPDKTLAADAVVITQETMAAIEQLFDIELNDAWLTKLRENTESVVCTFIGVGIRAKISQTPIPKWELEEPITYAGKTITEIGFQNYFGREGYAPEGCTTLTTTLTGDTYNFWKKAKEEGCYEEEKRKLADQLCRVICQKFPQSTGNIEVIDIATPLTYERYTGAYHGSWMSITGLGKKMRTYPGFLKNIRGVYFAGHRLMTPGGFPVALYSGYKAAQMVCRQFDAIFR